MKNIYLFLQFTRLANIVRSVQVRVSMISMLSLLSPALQAQWSGSSGVTGPINRQGKVVLNSTGWDEHLEISRLGYGATFLPDNSGGYQGLRLNLLSGSNFYVLNGNMGVGVTAPSTRLHVDGDLRLSGVSRKIVVGTEGDISDYLLLQDVGAGTPAFQWMQDGAAKFNIEGTTGNVGIGVDLATDKLHINGDLRFKGSARKLIVGTESNVSDYLLLQDIASGNPAFQWVQDGSPKFTIEGVTGNVGIGTATPDARLAVKGSIHTQEVNVDLTGAVGPDYVFEKDYNLPPLHEVERYIKENKHLPEVPSAKEMEAEGINLKEMNLLLLKKVEELTLHLIAKEKKMIEMERRILELEKK